MQIPELAAVAGVAEAAIMAAFLAALATGAIVALRSARRSQERQAAAMEAVAAALVAVRDDIAQLNAHAARLAMEAERAGFASVVGSRLATVHATLLKDIDQAWAIAERAGAEHLAGIERTPRGCAQLVDALLARLADGQVALAVVREAAAALDSFRQAFVDLQLAAYRLERLDLLEDDPLFMQLEEAAAALDRARDQAEEFAQLGAMAGQRESGQRESGQRESGQRESGPREGA
ncbi:MAG: hypothetical protein JNK11_17625 [Alphaproteobacteria bacterium]|nr:hypothetical protein [Alphaproteobacteria bacterium]